MGDECVAQVLQLFDKLYPQNNGESALQQLQVQLAAECPAEISTGNGWQAVYAFTVAAMFAEYLADHRCWVHSRQQAGTQEIAVRVPASNTALVRAMTRSSSRMTMDPVWHKNV